MPKDLKLHPRERLLRDPFTPAEKLLFSIILIAASVGFWFADPRSGWLLGFFLIVGCLSPFVLKTHQDSHPFIVTRLWPGFWLYTSPVWILLLQSSIGLLQDPISVITIEGDSFLTLNKASPLLPVSTGFEESWLPLLGLSSIYLVAVNLFIVPKSKVFFERLLPWLCLGSVLVCIFGYIQTALDLDAPLLTKGTGANDFFAFFPYEGHWAAFACLWTAANFGMARLKMPYRENKQFIDSIGPWYLTGGSLLGTSAFLIEAKWPATVLMLTFSLMLMLMSVAFFKSKTDPHRRALFTICGLASVLIFIAGIFKLLGDSPQSETRGYLRQAAYDMFMDRPLFGWGFDSFNQLLPFYGNDFLLSENYKRAGSDLAQILAELGLVGALCAAAIMIAILIRYFKGKADSSLTNHLLLGCGAVALLSIVDSPFMSPAVHLSFFVILFTALRWADLCQNEADQVDVHGSDTMNMKRNSRFKT
jgi:hypothetical protein